VFEIFMFTGFGLAYRGMALSLQNGKATAGAKINHCAKYRRFENETVQNDAGLRGFCKLDDLVA
jgi:hypothetical protein